ncbi:MAG: hypothetical protein RL580_1454, partial [Pseudomonadota bacterium]
LDGFIVSAHGAHLDAALVESAADFTSTLIYSANEVDSG